MIVWRAWGARPLRGLTLKPRVGGTIRREGHGFRPPPSHYSSDGRIQLCEAREVCELRRMRGFHEFGPNRQGESGAYLSDSLDQLPGIVPPMVDVSTVNTGEIHLCMELIRHYRHRSHDRARLSATSTPAKQVQEKSGSRTERLDIISDPWPVHDREGLAHVGVNDRIPPWVPVHQRLPQVGIRARVLVR